MLVQKKQVKLMHATRTQDGGYPLKGRVGVLTGRELEDFCHPGKVHLALGDFMRESLCENLAG